MKKASDECVEQRLLTYVNVNKPTSFFLTAGAGSGKTYSLVNILRHVQKKYKKSLNKTGKQVAVITYTKAASEEIKARIAYDSIFSISTIHSFCWSFLQHFQKDLKKWYVEELEHKREKLKGKKSRVEKINQKIDSLSKDQRIVYSPDSNDGTIDHTSVLKAFSEFLSKDNFRNLLVRKHPVLLVDECQDTEKSIMTALLDVEKSMRNKDIPFGIGLFGDMEQRIYTGGKEDLIEAVKENRWKLEKKEMNHRSARRIVKFINKIRDDSSLTQYARADAIPGRVKVYICLHDDIEQIDKYKSMEEQAIKDFSHPPKEFKYLILEHRMAARRNGFLNLYEALGKNPTSSQFQDMDGKEITFIVNEIIPMIQALTEDDFLKQLEVMRKSIYQDRAEQANVIDRSQLKQLHKDFKKLKDLVQNKVMMLDVLKRVNSTKLINLPEFFQRMIGDLEDSELNDPKVSNWQEALHCSIEEFIKYFNYKTEMDEFLTQHGSKGLEFENVAVILNDGEARGNMFRYMKLLGTHELSETDTKNIKSGKDNALSRVKRLLYVAASRAEENLVIIIHAKKEEREQLELKLSQEWDLQEGELQVLEESQALSEINGQLTLELRMDD